MADKRRHRVAKAPGTEIWIIKEPPGWRVAFRARTLLEIAAWCGKRGINPADVVVVHQGSCRSLAEWLAEESNA